MTTDLEAQSETVNLAVVLCCVELNRHYCFIATLLFPKYVKVKNYFSTQSLNDLYSSHFAREDFSINI